VPPVVATSFDDVTTTDTFENLKEHPLPDLYRPSSSLGKRHHIVVKLLDTGVEVNERSGDFLKVGLGLRPTRRKSSGFEYFHGLSKRTVGISKTSEILERQIGCESLFYHSRDITIHLRRFAFGKPLQTSLGNFANLALHHDTTTVKPKLHGSPSLT
jgi:hypothetical protein